MLFGTFDNFHPGHLNYFKQAWRFAKSQGGKNELVIIVARDNNVLSIKGQAAQEDEKIRARKARLALKELGYPGKVVLGSLTNKWLVIRKYQPAIICLGYDQKVDLDKLKDELKKSRLFCKIKRLRAYHPEKYKSSYSRLQ